MAFRDWVSHRLETVVTYSEMESSSGISVPEPGHVHIWHLDLDAVPEALARWRRTLSKAECARADRFYREEHQNRFIAGRGQLRALLGHYVALPPGELSFVYNAEGKPRLSEALNPQGLTFNLSHSGAYGVCAVARDRAVGVDIEYCRPNRDIVPIARRFFSPLEVSELLSLPEERQTAGFYQCWTSKEALIKAWGIGLKAPLDAFTVRVTPGETGLVALGLPAYEGGDWQIYGLSAPADTAASLATAGPVTHIVTLPFAMVQS